MLDVLNVFSGLLGIYLYLGRRYVKDYRIIFTIKAVSLIIINNQIKNKRVFQ